MGCGVCGADHAFETCNLLGRFDPVSDTPTLSYARLSLPTGLVVRDLINGSKTVIATKTFIRGVQFGPFKAAMTPILSPSISFPLKIFLKSGENVFLKTDEEHYSNWMCLVAMATCVEEVNMYCYQMDENIYFSVITDVLPGAELKVWYAPHYAKMMNVEPLRHDSYLVEPDVSPEDTEMVGDHQYLNGKKRKKNKQKLINGSIADCELPDSIKGKLPAEVLGATKSELEWKCRTCNVTEPNLAAYARHLIIHIKSTLRVKCSHCKIRRNGKHEINCKVHLFSKGLTDGSDLTEEERNKTIKQPNGANLSSDNILSDVTNSLNTNTPADTAVESLAVKDVTPTIDTSKQSDNLFMNCDKDNDFVNYQFEIMNNKNNLNMQVSDFFGKTIWNNDSGISIDNVNTLVPLTDSGLSLKERQLDINPPILDLSDEIEFQSLKNFSDTIDANRFIDKPYMCRNVGCPDLFDNVAVSNLLNGVDNISTSPEQFPIFSLDKSEFLEQKFDNLLEVTDEDKNRLVENLLKETDERINVYEDELKDDNGEMAVQETKKKEKVEASALYPCEICKGKFSRPKYLIRHLRKHTGEFSCKYCMNIFARKETLISHTCLSGSNLENIKEQCGICSMVLYSKRELRVHIAEHYCTYSRWECKHCKAGSDDVERLDRHYCVEGDGLERQFCCDNCYKVFATSSEFAEHRHEINKKRTKAAASCYGICEVCGLLMKKKVLRTHIRINHRGIRFECKECGKKFTRKDSLLKHKLTHAPAEFSCSVCGKLFIHKLNRDVHALTHLKKPTKFACEHCGKTFLYKYNMLIHVKRHFTTYTCDLCQKTFSSKTSFSNHSTEHVQGPPKFQPKPCESQLPKKVPIRPKRRRDLSVIYSCHYCDSKMRHRQSLKRHLVSRHSESKKEWDVEGGLDSMKIAFTTESDKKQVIQGIQKDTFEVSVPHNIEIADKEGLPDLVTEHSISVTGPQEFIASKERLLDLANSTSTVSLTDSEDLVTLSKEKLLDLVNGTLNIPIMDPQELVALSKEKLLDFVNGTSDVSSQDMIGVSKEGLLDLVNGASNIPVTTVGHNMENITVNVLWTNVDEPMAESEALSTKNDAIVPMVQLAAPEEFVGLNVDNSCLNNGIGTYILEDGRIMNEHIQLGGDIFLYVVEPSADEQELLFV